MRKFEMLKTGLLGCAIWATVVLLFHGGTLQAQPVAGRLLPRDQIGRIGLVRSWFAQVQMDRGRSRVARSILSGDQLFVLTDAGTLQALNALTGETQWVVTLGDPNHPSLGPAANDTQVAMVNGSTLFVVNRFDG